MPAAKAFNANDAAKAKLNAMQNEADEMKAMLKEVKRKDKELRKLQRNKSIIIQRHIRGFLGRAAARERFRSGTLVQYNLNRLYRGWLGRVVREEQKKWLARCKKALRARIDPFYNRLYKRSKACFIMLHGVSSTGSEMREKLRRQDVVKVLPVEGRREEDPTHKTISDRWGIFERRMVDVGVRFIYPDGYPSWGNKMFEGRDGDWYDPATVHPAKEEDIGRISHSVAAMNELIESLIEEGIPSHSIVIGGFDTGATVALQTSLLSLHGLGGVVMMGGFLSPDSRVWSTSMCRASPPIYWVHGVEDPLCKVKWARATVRLLTDRAHVSGGSRVRGDTMCTRFRFEEVDHPVQPSHGEVTLLLMRYIYCRFSWCSLAPGLGGGARCDTWMEMMPQVSPRGGQGFRSKRWDQNWNEMSVHYKQAELDKEWDNNALHPGEGRSQEDILVSRRKGAQEAYERGLEAVKCVEDTPAYIVKLTENGED